jgi:hypothetical protein
MKRARGITLFLAAFGMAALSGCGLVTVSHPTTESRYMSPTEQAFWTDRQSRQDKSAEWSANIQRQSEVRMSRYMDFNNW